MAERIYGLLKELDHFIDGGIHIGFINRVLLDETRVLEFVEAIRESLPGEIQQARTLLNARQEILRKANEDAKQRQDSLSQVMQDPQIHSADRERANRMLQDARREALYIRQEADAYVEQSLKRVHRLLAAMDQEVMNGLAYLGREDSAGQVG